MVCINTKKTVLHKEQIKVLTVFCLDLCGEELESKGRGVGELHDLGLYLFPHLKISDGEVNKEGDGN